MSAAVQAAQEQGYAEAHPETDLEGIDAAEKVILLARAAFDVNLPLHAIARKGLEGLNSKILRTAQEHGKAVRLVAECRRSSQRVEASVKPVELPLSHPLAQVNGAENRLLIQPEVGEPWMVSGTGAGRWPTTEAVIADLFDIRRQGSAETLKELEACA